MSKTTSGEIHPCPQCRSIARNCFVKDKRRSICVAPPHERKDWSGEAAVHPDDECRPVAWKPSNAFSEYMGKPINDLMTTQPGQANIKTRDGACSGAPSHTLNLKRRFSMSDDQRTSAPAVDKILGCFTSQELIHVLRQLEDFHEKYDFQFTIYRFSTHWKVSLQVPEHSIQGRLLLWELLPGSDLVTAIKIALSNMQGDYRSAITQKIWNMDEDQAQEAFCKAIRRPVSQ